MPNFRCSYQKLCSILQAIFITVMASIAPPKANPCFLSRNNLQRLKITQNRAIKIPFFSELSSRRLVSVCSNNPDLGSTKMDQTVSGFGSGTRGPPILNASSSPSTAIDFLTLCHRLKVCGDLHICIFLYSFERV